MIAPSSPPPRPAGWPAASTRACGAAGVQIQLLNHIRDSQELYGMTWPASSG